MKKYLKNLPNKSPEHKRRFALITSGGATLLIFGIWTFVHFGPEPQLVQNTNGPVELAAASTAEVSPFENVLSGLKESWTSVTSLFTNGQ